MMYMCSTLAYPRCTRVSNGVYQTDCGSTAWAFSMFIAWNLLSMVRAMHDRTPSPRTIDRIFFCLVHLCQHVHRCRRGELFVRFPVHRRCLEVDHASRDTCIQKGLGRVLESEQRSIRASKPRSVPRCTSVPPNSSLSIDPAHRLRAQKLTGVFEVRVYPPQYSTASILAACQDKSKKGNRTGGIHVRKLNKLLNKIDFGVIRKRRAVYMRIYHEASVICYRGGGISFTDMLVLLAHHKLIDDREALG